MSEAVGVDSFISRFEARPLDSQIKDGFVLCPKCQTRPALWGKIVSSWAVMPCDECVTKQRDAADSAELDLRKVGMKRKNTTLQDKIENLSPEEVLNGVQYGIKYTGHKSTKTYTEEKKAVIRELHDIYGTG